MQTSRDEHPFLIWYAYLNKRAMAVIRKRDIFLNDIGAARFAMGVDEDSDRKTPALGVGVHDSKAIKSIDWSSAGFILGHKNRDWLALAARDIRQVDSVEPDPVPMRLWIPFTTGLFNAWAHKTTDKLELKRVKNGKGVVPVFEKTPFLSVSLQLKNHWSDLPS
ncbi:hypothetical protein [Salipiger mucosus]|uniref:Uncharacterized protein n=1 Tax=Salipiger mucosus DSM 16094 TaxID=1123237 RepID=S9S1B6_9RHOB|nr:hypothetical protein [Salipiger mucosus]EPX84000.1 hypothetical protein Salmuc_01775 [Salipiger mucosus DSM 16094]